MVGEDVAYVKRCIGAGLVHSPCLELGVGYEGPNNKDVIEKAGIKYYGTDRMPGEAVDYLVDFEDSVESVERGFYGNKFGSILVLNVLEHAYEPMHVLDNVFHILQPRGTCIIVTPAVWPLHNYPYDYWRINPNFYEEYCKRRSLQILSDYFEYVGLHNVKKNMIGSDNYMLPSPSQKRSKAVISRVVHKLFNTYGRGMRFPSFVAIGVVIKKPE